jgi:hypothetical protein
MKHHYVPVFYQKYFAASDGRLWVYDRKLKTCKQLHPRSICFKHDLYAFKVSGAFNQIVETGFLRAVDGGSAKAFTKLLKDIAAPTPELLGQILFFAALQHTRVPANKQMISLIHESGASDLMQVAFANVERATAMVKKYEAETGENLGVTPESMVKAVGRIRPVATEVPFIQSVVEHTDMVAKVFSELDVRLLISPPQVGFILADNPVTTVPPPWLRVAGFKSPGTFVFMPLTRYLCLRFGQPGTGNGPKFIDRETVRLINENTATNSDRFVMGPSKVQIESVIRRSRSTEINPKPRWITVKSVDEKGGILRQMISQPREFHYANATR